MDLLSIIGAFSGLAVQLILVVGLTAWAFVVAKKRGGRYRHLRWLPMLGLLALVSGASVTIVMLVGAFDGIAFADPAERASRLSEGISRAMWGTACGLFGSAASYLGSAAASAYGTWGPSAKTPAK